MHIARPLDLNVTAEEATQRQLALAQSLDLSPGALDVQWIGATDVAYDKHTDEAYAAVVVLDAQTMEVVEVATWVGEPGYPYVPGLFGLREASCLLGAFEKLERVPDVVLVDGQGIAHPRRFGLACLLGWVLDVPTIGCAKKVLCGHFDELPQVQGARQPLMDGTTRIGDALRTQDGINPVYVSPGYRYDLDTATALVARCAGAYRIPEPLRQAHHHSILLRAEYAEASQAL